MTSVTLCELLFFLRFHIVFAIVFIWNWRCAIPWVIMLFHSKDPNHCDCVTHSEKWCWQRKHMHTPTVSALVPPHAHDNVEKHIQSTLLLQCALNFRQMSMFGWYSDLCKGLLDPRPARDLFLIRGCCQLMSSAPTVPADSTKSLLWETRVTIPARRLVHIEIHPLQAQTYHFNHFPGTNKVRQRFIFKCIY